MSSQAPTSKRLEKVRLLAQRREDEAARRMADARRQLADREAQLSELERYLAERSLPREGLAFNPAQLANRDAFLGRLADALRHQSTVVSDARARSEQAREQWLTRHRDTDALGHLVKQSERREMRTQQGKQQKELDDFAIRPRPQVGG